jgi:very-short-patch-repair endonuclease
MALAGAQHWVVTFAELTGLGFSESAVNRLLAAGRLHRLFKGVYAVGRPEVSAYGLRLAAVLACGPGALLSHISAAAHHGLRESSAIRIDVTVPRRSHLKHPGVRIHRRETLISEDRTAVNAVPCTSVARTLLDIAPLIHERALEKAIERAEIQEVYDHRAIVSLLGRARGQPGTRRLADVLGIGRPGCTVTNSSLEELMLGLCRRWNLPQPEVNAELLLGGQRAQVDFLWREQRVVIEVDGFKYHRTRAAFRRDRRRDRLLELEGYGHARFADEEFDTAQAEIRATLISFLGL